MKKLMFFAFFLIAVGTYAQDHNSVRGRLNLIGSSGSDAFDLNLIRTGPDANKVVFSWARVTYYAGEGQKTFREFYNPDGYKGPSASFLIPNRSSEYADNVYRVEFTVFILIEQKNAPMGDWPNETWSVSVDLETGATSYRVEGVKTN